VRTLPRVDAPLVGVVPQGQSLWVSEEAPGGWRRTQLGGERFGYILDEQVRVELPPSPPARVRPPSSRLERPTVVRLELDFACIGCGLFQTEDDLSDASAFALSVAHNFTDAWSIEGTVGYDSSHATQTTPAIGMFPAMTSTVDVSPGTTLMLNGRWAPLRSWWGHHALTVAGGALAIMGGAYGRVPFLHGEVAYEYRPHTPFTFIFGVGPDVALAGSPSSVTAACNEAFLFATCRRPFREGDLLLRFRLGIGASF
jgi:hypothetical protein